MDKKQKISISTKNKQSSSNASSSGKKSAITITESLDSIAKAIEFQAKVMNNIQPFLATVSELKKVLSNNDTNTGNNIDGNGEIVITSLEIPSNHLDSSNSFKGKDTDVERFLSMCYRQFEYYERFYKSEKKRVEFIESHLGTASDWYYTYMSGKQIGHPDSKLLLGELKKFYLTDLPDSLKYKRLKELNHKWGNASEFVAKFKLYATQLKIPEIVQLELFEDRVNPLVKRKLQDLEPLRRNIDTYSSMLMTYDNERDRHWSFESMKRKNILPEEEQSRKKRARFRKNKQSNAFNENWKNNEKNSTGNNFQKANYNTNIKSNNNYNNYNRNFKSNEINKGQNDSKNSKKDFQ